MADVPWKIDDTQQPDAVPWKIDDTQQPQSEPPVGQGLNKIGRVLIQTLASPAVLASKAAHKVASAAGYGDKVADLGPMLDEQLDKYAPHAGFVEDVAKSAPAFAIPGGWIPQIAGNAAIGAVEAPKGEELKGGATGAAFGTVGKVLSKALGGLVTPTADAKVLIDKGVALTPGQAAGAGSWLGRTEQSLSSGPVAAPFIRPAQRRAVEEANVAAAQSVASIVDKNIKLGLPPKEAIEKTREAIGKAYNDSLDGLVAYKGGVQEALVDRAANIVADHPMLDPKDATKIENYVLNRFANIPHLPSGSDWKRLDSEIGGYVRQLYASPNAADKTAAAAWRDVHQAFRDSIESVMQQGKAEQLGQANAAWRQLLAMEKARGPNETMTPRRLRQSLEKAGIKGTDLNRVSEAMDSTLPNVVNDSGTTERLLTNSLPALLMGSGYGANQAGWDTIGSGMVAAGALGTRTGARFLTGGLPGQAMVSAALRRTTPAALQATQRKDK